MHAPTLLSFYFRWLIREKENSLYASNSELKMALQIVVSLVNPLCVSSSLGLCV